MKNHCKFQSIIILLILVSSSFYAVAQKEPDSPLALSITTDAAYYPESSFKSGNDHFAPISGVFDSFEFCTTLNAEYTIKTPLGEHWLVKDAQVVLAGGCELSPVTVKPELSVSFQPFPFYIISAGAAVGLGWNISDINGLSKLNTTTRKYEDISTVNHPFYDFWLEETLQFDTGALIPGDWSHVILVASSRFMYTGISGIDKHELYEWQCTKNQVRGFQYAFTGIIGYQMPLVLNFAGLMCTAEGHFNGNDYGDIDDRYNGSFTTISISPLFQFTLNDKDSLTTLIDFSSRRSFEVDHDKTEEEPYLKCTGREWYFKRVAVSWTHIF